jgi:hypothetical protein
VEFATVSPERTVTRVAGEGSTAHECTDTAPVPDDRIACTVTATARASRATAVRPASCTGTGTPGRTRAPTRVSRRRTGVIGVKRARPVGENRPEEDTTRCVAVVVCTQSRRDGPTATIVPALTDRRVTECSVGDAGRGVPHAYTVTAPSDRGFTDVTFTTTAVVPLRTRASTTRVQSAPTGSLVRVSATRRT